MFNAVQGLDPGWQEEVVRAAIENLPEPQRRQVVGAAAATLAPPTRRATDRFWFVVMGILAVVIVGGGWIAATLDGSDEAALYGFVGVALGAVVSLLAPSPTHRGHHDVTHSTLTPPGVGSPHRVPPHAVTGAATALPRTQPNSVPVFADISRERDRRPLPLEES